LFLELGPERFEFVRRSSRPGGARAQVVTKGPRADGAVRYVRIIFLDLRLPDEILSGLQMIGSGVSLVIVFAGAGERRPLRGVHPQANA